MKKKVVRFCLECKKKLVGYDQEKFCSRECYIKARKSRGWFAGCIEMKKTYNCFNPSRCRS